MHTRLRRLVEFSFEESVLLLLLSIGSLVLFLSLRVVSLQALVTWLARAPDMAPVRFAARFLRHHEPTRLATLTDLAAWRATGEGRCLIRSLLLFCLLKIRGDAPSLLIGVSRDTSALKAHAWIETSSSGLLDLSSDTIGLEPIARF
jgi:hypothetical protein